MADAAGTSDLRRRTTYLRRSMTCECDDPQQHPSSLLAAGRLRPKIGARLHDSGGMSARPKKAVAAAPEDDRGDAVLLQTIARAARARAWRYFISVEEEVEREQQDRGRRIQSRSPSDR